MQVSIEEINAFHRFAVRRMQEAGRQPLTMQDLLFEWDSHSNHEAMAEGLAAMEAGRTRPANEVLEELRSKRELAE